MKYEILLAGLGNPGEKYKNTPHNVGFMIVDALLEHVKQHGTAQKLNGKKFNAELWEISDKEISGEWLVCKPQTFMNDSGAAIAPILKWHNMASDNLIVAHDELDLPPGALRFKFGGGLAGHNGLLSIAQHLGSQEFYRLRLGIGKPQHKEETIQWVLGRFPEITRKKILAAIPYALETLFIFSKAGFPRAVEFAHAALKAEEQENP